MDVTIIGCGYVGLVTATCLASIGHTVRGVEMDQKKLKVLKDGHCPIFEPGLQELMQEHYAAGSLQFTENVKNTTQAAEVVVLAVASTPEAFRMMRRLYDPIVKREEAFMTMNWESAELTKYAANAMLAARISFMNEMTILCEGYGADIEDIRKGIGSDFRIGPAFLKAGCGYGGSCFPKDVAAMEHISRAAGHESLFVHAIQTINKNQKARFVEKIVEKLGRPIEGAKIAVWGLAFKADTDDIRESA